MNVIYFETPIGLIELKERDNKIISLDLTSQIKLETKSSEILENCKKQIIDYFQGNLKIFDCPLFIEGSEFQKKVYLKTLQIPYGQTLSYKQLAISLSKKNSFRAVANVLSGNKIPILIPCHRVIGSDGSLKGYKLGLDIKRFLLRLEGVLIV